jgi:ABC-type uncharacterized transport system auxiliary subunit
VSRAALALLGASLLGTSCLAPQNVPPAVFYEVRPERSGPPAKAVGTGAVRVGRVRTAPLVERTAFVYRTGERTFEADFYHHFSALPGVLVREALVDWLERSGLFAEVRRGGPPERARWALEARVVALHADVRDPAAPRAVVEMEVLVLERGAPAGEELLRNRYRAEVPSSAEPAALAEAWTRALTQILSELEDDLRGTL